ncbi:signal peptidase II [Buchnera aphidicola]|uniref:signal peptidase II n=1 Tax=Buchnera aphidicola TaxID=9 RepID=UPI003D18DF39
MILLTDLYSKYYIIHNIKPNESKPIFSVIHILYVQNYGIAFNIFDVYYEKLYYIFMVLFLIFIYIYFKKLTYTNNIAYIFIFSGGISNIINRLYYGFIIDFIDIKINNYSIIIFNFADLIIIIGIVTILCNFQIFEQFKK